MKDYTITMKDSTGRTCVLHINGDEVQDAIKGGYSEAQARCASEDNQFANAIYRGEIGTDAWLVSVNK